MQMIDCCGNVRSGRTRLMRVQIPDQSKYVTTAFPGRDEEFYLIREEEQSHFVAVLDGAESDDRTDLRRNFAFQLGGRSEVLGTGDVDGEHDGLFTLFVIQLDVRITHPR